jgi:hypothetical protein
MRFAALAIPLVLLAAMTGTGTVARAQDRVSAGPADGDDQAEACRQAVLRFMDAVNAGDARTVEDLISVMARTRVQSQFLGRAVVARCVEWQRALERAAAARWGADAAKAFGGVLLSFTDADRAAVANAKVFLRAGDNSAVLITGVGVAPVLLRSGGDGQWRVVLRLVSYLFDVGGGPGGGGGGGAEDSTRVRLRYLDRVERALFHVAWRVREKQIPTVEAARKELEDAIRLAGEQKDVTMDPAAAAQLNARVSRDYARLFGP